MNDETKSITVIFLVMLLSLVMFFIGLTTGQSLGKEVIKETKVDTANTELCFKLLLNKPECPKLECPTQIDYNVRFDKINDDVLLMKKALKRCR